MLSKRIGLTLVILFFILAGLCRRCLFEQPAINTPNLLVEADAAKSIPGIEHYSVFTPQPGEPTFSHHAHLASFNDQLSIVWSRGLRDEDSSSQEVVQAVSGDSTHWNAPTIVASDPDREVGGLRRTAGGYQQIGSSMVAYVSTFSEGPGTRGPRGESKWSPDLKLEAFESKDLKSWSQIVLPSLDFMMNEPPRLTSGGVLLATGEDHSGAPKILRSANPNSVDSWQVISIPSINLRLQPNEPSWFEGGGRIGMFLRDDNGSYHLYFSYSDDGGKSFSTPLQSKFRDSRSKNYAGRLPNGDFFIVSNSNPAVNRQHLTLALSKDGTNFNRLFLIRSEKTETSFDGQYKVAGYAYPTALIWRDRLLVGYSINKEQIAISSIPLSSISS